MLPISSESMSFKLPLDYVTPYVRRILKMCHAISTDDFSLVWLIKYVVSADVEAVLFKVKGKIFEMLLYDIFDYCQQFGSKKYFNGILYILRT